MAQDRGAGGENAGAAGEHETRVRAFAASRSHQDALASQTAISTAFNTLVVLSSGAAVAFLGFYGDLISSFAPGFVWFFGAGEALYFLAAVLALRGIHWFREYVGGWATYWQNVAIFAEGAGFDAVRPPEDFERRRRTMRRFGAASYLAFVAATVAIGYGMAAYGP